MVFNLQRWADDPYLVWTMARVTRLVKAMPKGRNPDRKSAALLPGAGIRHARMPRCLNIGSERGIQAIGQYLYSYLFLFSLFVLFSCPGLHLHWRGHSSPLQWKTTRKATVTGYKPRLD